MPEDKVRTRRERSFAQLPWFFAAADEAWLFDNSGDEPRLVGRKRDDRVTLSDALIPEIMDRLTAQG